LADLQLMVFGPLDSSSGLFVWKEQPNVRLSYIICAHNLLFGVHLLFDSGMRSWYILLRWDRKDCMSMPV